MIRKTKLILILSILFIGISCKENTPTNPFVDYTSSVYVNRVIDGDTFTFLINNEEFSIRILGIDCFETKHNDRLIGQAEKNGITEDSAYTLGNIAKSLADSLLTGKTVRITRDSSEADFDTYGRLLRNVFVNGKSYAQIIISRGLSAN